MEIRLFFREGVSLSGERLCSLRNLSEITIFFNSKIGVLGGDLGSGLEKNCVKQETGDMVVESGELQLDWSMEDRDEIISVVDRKYDFVDLKLYFFFKELVKGSLANWNAPLPTRSQVRHSQYSFPGPKKFSP